MQDILMEINNLSYRYEDGTLALDQVSLPAAQRQKFRVWRSGRRRGGGHPCNRPGL